MSDSKEINSEEKLILKDYSKWSARALNRTLRLREKQITAADAGKPTTGKRLNQLKYERDAIMTTLLERAMTTQTDLENDQPQQT